MKIGQSRECRFEKILDCCKVSRVARTYVCFAEKKPANTMYYMPPHQDEIFKKSSIYKVHNEFNSFKKQQRTFFNLNQNNQQW